MELPSPPTSCTAASSHISSPNLKLLPVTPPSSGESPAYDKLAVAMIPQQQTPLPQPDGLGSTTQSSPEITRPKLPSPYSHLPSYDDDNGHQDAQVPSSEAGNAASTGSQSRAAQSSSAAIDRAHSEFCEDAELRQLLEQHGLGQYSSLFAEHEVDLGTFGRLKESHLMEMGLHRVGTRVKMTTLISEVSEKLARDRSDHHDLADLLLPQTLLVADQEEKQLPPPSLNTLQPVRQQTPVTNANSSMPPPYSGGEGDVFERSRSRPGEIPFEELVFQECVGHGSFGAVYK